VLVGFGAFGVWWGGWGAALPAVQANARVDDGQLGAALLFVGVGALASMRLTGALIDRFGRVLLPLSMLVFAVVGLTPAFALGGVQLAAALVVVGFASGAMDVGINTAGSDYESAAQRPVMNLAHGAFSIGVIFASTLVGAMRSTDVGLALILGSLGILVGSTAAAIHFFGRDEELLEGQDESVRPSPLWSAPSRRLVVLGVLAALAYLVENAWQSWSAIHLERTLSAAPALSALGPAAFGGAAALGRLGGHGLSDRISRRALVRAGASLGAVGTLIGAAAPTVQFALVGIVAAGLGTAVCAPSLFSLAGEGVDARERGAAMGAVTTFAYLGFIIGPAAVGLIARLISLPTALGIVSGAAVILALIANRARAADGK